MFVRCHNERRLAALDIDKIDIERLCLRLGDSVESYGVRYGTKCQQAREP